MKKYELNRLAKKYASLVLTGSIVLSSVPSAMAAEASIISENENKLEITEEIEHNTTENTANGVVEEKVENKEEKSTNKEIEELSYYTEGFEAESISLQPGETENELNITWYAKGSIDDIKGKAQIKYNETIIDASVSEIQTPTNNVNEYDGYVVCKGTLTNLTPDTVYTYQLTVDGDVWSKEYTYTTPKENSFTFAFTSDPQIKDSDDFAADKTESGWSSYDEKNSTGWEIMMEEIADKNATLVVSAGDQVENQSWGKKSEYDAFLAPEELSSIAYAPAVGNHDRHYMFDDHFNLPNEMEIGEGENELTPVYTTFRGQNSGTSLSHGNYTQATDDEISNKTNTNGVVPNEDGKYDYEERRIMETKGNYYYLYNNMLFVTLNTGAYPGTEEEAKEIVENFRKTMQSAVDEYSGQYDWLVVTHHKSTQSVAKHVADADIEYYVDAGLEKLMDEFDVDFALAGHDHVYARSYALYDQQRVSERLDHLHDNEGTIYLTGNCCSDMQYYNVFEKVDKADNEDYPVLANGLTGSQAYLSGLNAPEDEKSGYLPYGNQEYNQEYKPSYAIFDVEGDTVSVKVYNLEGDSTNPDSVLIDSFTVSKNADGGKKVTGYDNSNSTIKATQIARYDSGMTNADGGVMEIVDYNYKTGWAYSVNGQTGELVAIPLKTIEEKENVDLLDGNDIDVKSLVEDDEFIYGDMTSVAVSPDGTMLAVAIQAEGYNANGRVAIFKCNDDGTLKFIQTIETGVQPDMVTFTPDGSKILTANEGEPREGYTSEDPKGTITIIDVETKTPVNVDFTAYDTAEARQSLVDKGIVIKKNTNPSVDFEPEYIACTNDKAYVTLQEANAVSVIDINANAVTGIHSLGFEDYSKVSVDIDKKDEKYNPKTYESLRGIRMADAISVYTVNGTDYIITANEGDSREWGNYINEKEVNFKDGETSPTGKITAENSGLTGKVVFFNSEDYDGLNSENDYIFGGRSVTMFKVEDDNIKEVFTSGDDFEAVTAKYLPEYFNCSNDDITIDDRSGKKGPEAETVTIGKVNDKQYAFVTLERIGGVMIYDITDTNNIKYVNYINSRDFSTDVSIDDSPEGLKFIEASKSPTDEALLIAACEVGGTVAVYELEKGKTEENSSSDNSSSSSSSGGGYTIKPTRPNETINEEDVPLAENTETDGKEPALFADVTENSWFYESLKFAVENNIISGINGKFEPDIKTTRAMVVAVLHRLSGNAISNGENKFTDIKSSDWYYNDVIWANANGIVSGIGNSEFAPNDNITREQLAVMVYQYAKLNGLNTEFSTGLIDSYSDNGEVSNWATEAMNFCIEKGIFTGKSSTELAPKDTATRAELVTVMYNLSKLK
ncbi:hypothetical protein B5E58_11510 [Tyzzerella sp. An114]|uniref:choice-of-anchor I family protein n=1 Tax=Tyzzerella sp. An114 TaxID=1965545 RepID=UPI000B42EC8B|nr:choice-of-anchor I family protein [Tyzzerella sp. An114]OUQ55929.1 hypothetical protein B5E58_11510 [Tyzzerella sp. An114]